MFFTFKHSIFSRPLFYSIKIFITTLIMYCFKIKVLNLGKIIQHKCVNNQEWKNGNNYISLWYEKKYSDFNYIFINFIINWFFPWEITISCFHYTFISIIYSKITSISICIIIIIFNIFFNK